VKHAAYKFDIVKKSDLASEIVAAVALASGLPFLANELASNVTGCRGYTSGHGCLWFAATCRNSNDEAISLWKAQ